MKILYIDMNVMYHAPDRNKIIHLLRHIGELEVFGLGFTDEAELNKLKEKAKGCDIVTISMPVITGIKQFFDENYHINEEGIKDFFKYYVPFFNIELIQKYYINITEQIAEIEKPKILLMLEYDYYMADKHFLENLVRKYNFYIVSYGKEFLGNFHKEAFKEKAYNLSTGKQWLEFINKHNDKFITFCHFIGEDEFFFGNLESRKYDIAVPGVEYYRRKKAIEKLKKTNLSMPSKLYNKIYATFNKIGINVYGSFIGIKLYNILFYNMLISSRFVYTVSGAFNGPVRKYFEIPASGACMIMDPFNGADKLGFKKNENFIYATYENLLEVLENISLKEAQQIAKNAQELIWQKHSTFARAKMLKDIFEAILSDSFNGTYWENGDIKIDYK